MTPVLLSKGFVAQYGASLEKAVREAGAAIRVVHLPDDGSPLAPDRCAEVEAAYLTREMRFSVQQYPAFADMVARAANLKWLHFASSGIDRHAFISALRERGVKLTTSTGTNAEPVAQSAIAGLLMLARGFPRWLDAQRRRAWEPMRGKDVPRDLQTQTIAIVGLGNVGAAIARFCQALRMHVIGVRRSPRAPDDPVDEMHTLAELPSILARCDFLMLACPFTPETRHLVNEETLALLPAGARVINVSRGAVVDEPALVHALETGRLGGAYLDVFEQEPLPPESALWDLPNVIISPHSASVSMGNDARAAEVFIANLLRYLRREPLLNEQ